MAFATHTDVATRLGRDLTSAEQATATAVISIVEGLVADAVSKDTAWAVALSPVPAALKELAVSKAIGALANPNNVAVESETLGEYSHSQTFPREHDTGVFLTDAEGRLVRFAVHGTNTASVMLGSHFQEVEE